MIAQRMRYCGRLAALVALSAAALLAVPVLAPTAMPARAAVPIPTWAPPAGYEAPDMRWDVGHLYVVDATSPARGWNVRGAVQLWNAHARGGGAPVLHRVRRCPGVRFSCVLVREATRISGGLSGLTAPRGRLDDAGMLHATAATVYLSPRDTVPAVRLTAVTHELGHVLGLNHSGALRCRVAAAGREDCEIVLGLDLMDPFMSHDPPSRRRLAQPITAADVAILRHLYRKSG